MKKLQLFSLSLLFLVSSCQSQTSKNIETIDSKSFAEKLKATEKPQILDVRTPEEFAQDRIENADNVNFLGSNFDNLATKYNKEKPVFVYCKVGGRSAKACDKLAEMGFKTIYNLDGGIMKWNANGLGKKSDKIIGICTQEYSDVIKKDKKVIVNFYAKWCEPCKKMQPYILKLKDELKGKVNLVRLDADDNKTILEEMKMDGLPVILIYENGKETYRHIGFLSEEELRKQL